MDKATALAAVKKHGSQVKAARALGIARQTLQHWLKKPGDARSKAPAAQPKVGKSLSEFRAAYDKNYIVPRRIREALKALGDGWEHTEQFRKLAGLSQTDVKTFSEQFADHIVQIERNKCVWVGTKANAAKMREMVS